MSSNLIVELEEPPNSEHQGLYSHKVGKRAALMFRGSKRRSGHQSSSGRKEINLDREEMAWPRLWKPDSSEAVDLARVRLRFSMKMPRDIHDSQNCDEIDVRQRGERRPRCRNWACEEHITPKTLYASYLTSLSICRAASHHFTQAHHRRAE